MTIPSIFIFLALFCNICYSFRVGVDLNTFSSNELEQAIDTFGRVDFTWAITSNSPAVPQARWRDSFLALNDQTVFSEDNPSSFFECKQVRSYAGTLTGAFGYKETGGVPDTMLTWNEITQYYQICNAGVIILTRAYWPNSDWRTKVEAVLSHPYLYGVALEYNPDDWGKRYEHEFVNDITSHGKSAFLLWPTKVVSNYPSENQWIDAMRYLKNNGANLQSPLTHFVVARYNLPYLPVSGNKNSIHSALNVARNFQQEIN